MPHYFPFNPNPRRPSRPPPPGSCDSQFHVFGPPEKYPVRPGAPYEMPSATFEAARTMHRALGFERSVIVQATTYGAEHRVALDALAALPHPVSTRQPPNEADLLELLYRVVPDERTLNRILVDNPAELFGFGP